MLSVGGDFLRQLGRKTQKPKQRQRKQRFVRQRERCFLMENIITREEYKRRHGKSESGYWVRVPEKWWRGALSGLKPIERCILVSLRVWGARKPSQSRLARELNTTRKTIRKYLKILKKKGLL